MNRFKISLLTIKHKTGSNASKFLATTISEFYEQMMNADFPFEYHSFTYTYEEKFQQHINAQKELSFKMDRYITRDDSIEENPYTQNLVVGSQILLEDNQFRHHLFTVNKIDYTFYQHNITYQYTCVDSFSYQLGRQNDGYEIKNDVASNDFLGSHTVDWWVRKIILPDCKISYKYQDLTATVVEHGVLVKRPIPSDSLYNRTVLFSGSGTANSVLISLGEENELMLNTYEHLESDGSLTTYFWYEPKKHAETSGLKYSPYNDVKSFSLSHSGNSLSTVLNVQTHTINDNLISLFPPVTPFFNNYLLSPQWNNFNYNTGTFTNLAYGITYHFSLIENAFPLTVDKAPKYDGNTEYSAGELIWSENVESATGASLYVSLQNNNQGHIPGGDELGYWYEIKDVEPEELEPDEFYYTGTTYTDKIPIINLIPNWVTNYYPNFKFESFNGDISYYTIGEGGSRTYSSQSLWKINTDITKTTTQYIPDDDILPPNVITNIVWLELPLGQSKRLYDYNIYLTFYRDPSEEDLAFAAIADSCPWLENKLIDFSYYQTHDILSKPELDDLNQTIQQNLCHVNGRLLVYAQDYYNALHQKTKLLADLVNNLDMIGATFEGDIVQANSRPGTMLDTSNFSKHCGFLNHIYDEAALNREKIGMLDLDDTISEYVNDYVNHEQQFLKNMFNFKRYFDAPVSILGENQTLYNYTFNLDSSKNYKFYGTNNNPTPYNIELINKTNLRPSVKLYKKDVVNNTNVYTPIEERYLVDQENYNRFYIPSIKEGNFIPASGYISNKRYYYITFTGKWNDGDAPEWDLMYNTKTINVNEHTYTFSINKLGDNTLTLKPVNHNYIINKDVIGVETWLTGVGDDAHKLGEYPRDQIVYVGNFTWTIKYQQATTLDIIKNEFYHTQDTTSWYIPTYDQYYEANDWPQQKTDLAVTNLAVQYMVSHLSGDWNVLDNKNYTDSASWKDYYQYFNPSLYYKIQEKGKDHYYPTTLVNKTNESSAYRRVMTWAASWQLIATWPLFAIPFVNICVAGAWVASTQISNLVKNNGNQNFGLTGKCKWNVDGNSLSSTNSWTNFEQLGATTDLFFTKNLNAYNDYLDLTNKNLWPSYIYPTYFALNAHPENQQSASFHYTTSWLRIISKNDRVLPRTKYYIINSEYLNVDDWDHTVGIKKGPYVKLNKQIFYPLSSVVEIFDTTTLEWDATQEFSMWDLLETLDEHVSYNEKLHQWTANSKTFYILLEEEYDLDLASSTNIEDANFIISQFGTDDNTYYARRKLTDVNQWGGLYITAQENDNYQLATSYDKNETYYYSSNGINNFTEAYTYLQCTNFYYYPSFEYSMSSFDRYDQIQTLPYYKSGNESSFDTEWNNVTLIEGIPKNKMIVNGEIIGEWSVTSEPLSGLTNGEFWTHYHTHTDTNLLIQYCSIIETNLTEYWTNAYAASKYAHFFLPESWLPRTDSGENIFYQGIVDDSEFKISGTNDSTYHASLSTHFIPEVRLITNSPHYNFKRYSQVTKQLAQEINDYQRNNLSFNDIISVSEIDNEAVKQMLVDDLKLDLTEWYAVIQYDNFVYYEYAGGGTTWPQALDLFTHSLIQNTHFDGWDLMIVSLLNSGYYTPYIPSKYYEYQSKHNQIWRELYTKYPSVILEKSFTYPDAITSQELLEAAQIAFNEYKQVERQYNISIIPYNKLKGNATYPLAIGDSIQLQVDEFYDGQDDISKSLTQLLFITDISYTLRNPADMSITVNTIKYTDKVIKELLHLIR